MTDVDRKPTQVTRKWTSALVFSTFTLCITANPFSDIPVVDNTDSNSGPRPSIMIFPTRSRSLQAFSDKKRESMPEEISFPAWLPTWYNHGDDWLKATAQESPIKNNEAGFHGQGGEDGYAVRNFFRGIKHGTYLEMGAFNGIKFSNTLHLHEALGWHGVLIEANPLSYLELVKNRRDDICINAAVCAQPLTVHMVESGGATAGIYEFMPATFLKTWYDGIDVSTLPTVRCLPLMAMLAKLGVNHIDFWSLDVEGGELEVLRTVDFNILRVGVLVVEADGHNESKNSEVRKILLSNKFTYHGAVGNNNWFLGPAYIPSANKGTTPGGLTVVRNPRQGGRSRQIVRM